MQCARGFCDGTPQQAVQSGNDEIGSFPPYVAQLQIGAFTTLGQSRRNGVTSHPAARGGNAGRRTVKGVVIATVSFLSAAHSAT
jgi:hypothetical protein